MGAPTQINVMVNKAMQSLMQLLDALTQCRLDIKSWGVSVQLPEVSTYGGDFWDSYHAYASLMLLPNAIRAEYILS